MRHHKVIEGELVDAPRALTAEPAGEQLLVDCVEHGSDRCGFTGPGCVQVNRRPDPPDERTWTERLTTFRVVDRRRGTIRR